MDRSPDVRLDGDGPPTVFRAPKYRNHALELGGVLQRMESLLPKLVPSGVAEVYLDVDGLLFGSL